MEYHFDIEHAQKYGLNEAIMIYNLRFWILKNKANERHQYDGRTWTYNSIPAFEELFPFWSYYQIKRILTSLVEKGVLVKGNYNASGYDKTSWYAFADESLFINASCIGQKETIDEAKSPDGRGENASPIPDNKQQIKNTDKKQGNKSKFIPPTKEEILEYCQEKNYTNIDVDQFYDYYDALDWHLSNGKKMSNWKASIVTWYGRRKATGNQSKTGVLTQDQINDIYSEYFGEE